MANLSMTNAPLMSLTDAEIIAGQLLQSMLPYCQQAKIAGSIRRKKNGGIKDIEIVAEALWVDRPDVDDPGKLSLFDDAPQLVRVNTLNEWAMQQSRPGPVGIPQQGICWIKTSTKNTEEEWQKIVPDAKGRYWRGLLSNGATLDLFITTPERWGATLLVRTGCAEFSEEIVTRAKTGRRYRFGKGGLCRWFDDGMEPTAQLVNTPTEEDVFDLLRLAYVPPVGRIGAHAVRRIDRPLGGKF